MKQTLKIDIFNKRESLSKKEILEKSEKIIENLSNLKEFKNAKNILFYVSFKKEVETQNLIKKLLKNKDARKSKIFGTNYVGKTILVPYIIKDDLRLHVSELKNFNELIPKTFGILEPKDLYKREFNPDKIDIVLVPGIAFDKNGHRIGYGYGFYDRFLKTIKSRTLKIGLGFDIQLIEKIPEEKHDVPLDCVITDNQILNIN